jgi:hypothetical protein
MLVLCYGIPRSGSTLAFEMVSEILRGGGFEQAFVRNDRAGPQTRKGKNARNYLDRISREAITELVAAIGPSRKIAVKTHGAFTVDLFPWLEELQRKGDMQVIASYRDPRDICLSLMEAGEKSRNKPVPGSFRRVDSFETAAQNVKHRVVSYRRWAALQGTLRLNYETVAFHPDDAIAKIEAVFGIKSDREQVKRHAFEDANTLKNEARSHRHLEDMDTGNRTALSENFRTFIRKACEEDDQNWYDKFRRKILDNLEAAPN